MAASVKENYSHHAAPCSFRYRYHIAPKTVVLDAAKQAVDMQRNLSIAKEDEMIAKLQSNGMKVKRDVNGAAFQEAIKPVWTAFISKNGDNLVNEIRAASAAK